MNKLTQQTQQLTLLENDSKSLQSQYMTELETNPKYSLQVDPNNQYNFPETQKAFIQYYVDYKNIGTAAEFAGIDMDTAKAYYLAYASQQEIRRINLALYQRQFVTRLISLDEIGGYLTSLLTDMNVCKADQLSTSQKLKVVQLLIDLNKLKLESMQDPSALMDNDIDFQIKTLSVSTIRHLLHQSKQEKQHVVYEQVNHSDLSPEEAAYLSTLPASDLLELIENSTNSKGET